MREIKFRAWDKIAKKFMWPWPDGFHLLGETTCFDLIGQQLKERSPEKNTLEMLNDVELMQYTGLHDKNGKEIYEGDIFRIPETPPEVNVIKYVDGAWYLHPHGLYLTDWYNRGEVIGNIYENPELLEKQ